MSRYDFLNALLHFLAFFMGAGIGSFLNVVIYRVPLGISVNNPKRSFCPTCKKQISMWENIPLFSWLALRGKCSKCASPISSRYFGVELLTAVLFYAVFWKLHGPWGLISVWGPQVLCLWVLTALLVSGSFIDIEHFILPFSITIGGTVAGLLAALWVPELVGVPPGDHWRGLGVSFGSAAAGIGSLWAISELGKLAFGRKSFRFTEPVEWKIVQPASEEPPQIHFEKKQLDWWDVFGGGRPTDRLEAEFSELEVNGQRFGACKLLLKMETMRITNAEGAHDFENEKIDLENHPLRGKTTHVFYSREAMGKGDAFLLMMIGAFLGWMAILFTILAASVLGCVFATIPRLTGRAEWSAKIPFGPYLAMGAMVWVFWGQMILDWYISKTMWR